MRLLRLPIVAEKVAKSRSAVYRDIQRGLLPPPVQTSHGIKAWPENEIDTVIAGQISGLDEEQLRCLVKQLVEHRAVALAVVLARSNGDNNEPLLDVTQIERGS